MNGTKLRTPEEWANDCKIVSELWEIWNDSVDTIGPATSYRLLSELCDKNGVEQPKPGSKRELLFYGFVNGAYLMMNREKRELKGGEIMNQPITDKDKLIQKMDYIMPKMDAKDVSVLYAIAKRLYINSDDQGESEAE